MSAQRDGPRAFGHSRFTLLLHLQGSMHLLSGDPCQLGWLQPPRKSSAQCWESFVVFEIQQITSLAVLSCSMVSIFCLLCCLYGLISSTSRWLSDLTSRI